MLGSNKIHHRPLMYFRRNVYFVVSVFLTTAFSGMFEMAYAQESYILRMLNNASSARIVDLTVNRTGMILDMRELLHGADKIQIAPESKMAFISQNEDFYILQIGGSGEIKAIRIDINVCKIIPWICMPSLLASADTMVNQPMQELDPRLYFPKLR